MLEFVKSNGKYFLAIVVVLLIIGALVYYLNPMKKESFEMGRVGNHDQPKSCVDYTNRPTDYDTPLAAEKLGNNENPMPLGDEKDDPTMGNSTPNECFPKDNLRPEELLPSDANTKWSQANPAGTGSLADKNYLNAGFHIGISTVGSSLRNANLQLRSEPPNPTKQISPFLQSTIAPDLNRRPLEIGCE